MSDYSEMSDQYWTEVRRVFLALEQGDAHAMLRMRLLLFGPNPEAIERGRLEPGWIHPRRMLRVVNGGEPPKAA